MAMSYSNPTRHAKAPNIDNMMERLKIDAGFRVVPRFGLLFVSALRNCRCCGAREACADWLAQDHETRFGAPQFCPNADLLSELLCDCSSGHRTGS
jgi:hypothetical protein